MRVVLDTNVLFAALAARGLCEALLQVCMESCQLVVSGHILKELRGHLIGKLKASEELAESFISLLRDHGEMVQPAEVPAQVCRDAGDLPVLGTAVAGEADFLVTGGRDLLTLKAYRGVEILGPRDFYSRLQG